MTYVRKMMEDERGYSDEQWKKMAELGWTGLILPEQYGGAGLTWSTWSSCSRRWAASSCRGRSSPPSILGGMRHRSRRERGAEAEATCPALAAGTLQGDPGAGRGERALGCRRHPAAGEGGRRRLRPLRHQALRARRAQRRPPRSCRRAPAATGTDGITLLPGRRQGAGRHDARCSRPWTRRASSAR